MGRPSALALRCFGCFWSGRARSSFSLMRTTLSWLIMALVAGCSGDKKQAEEPKGSDWEMPEPEPDPEPRDPAPSGDDDDDDPAPKPKPISRSDDYEINERDCDALAQAYGRAWKNDELDKLSKRKLPKPQFDKTAADIESGSEDMKENYREECYKTVGTAYLRSRLGCALKAKSLERFHACMDGTADE